MTCEYILMNIYKEGIKFMKRSSNKKLLKNKEIYKLKDGKTEYEEVWLYGKETPKIKKIISLYFLTAVMLILTISVIWLSGSVSSHALSTDSFFGRSAERMVRFFTKGDFLCFYLSDNSNNDVNNNETNNMGTTDDLNIPNTNNDKLTNSEAVPSTPNTDNKAPSLTKDKLYSFDYSLVPQGETAIIPMDLSLSSYGAYYINNSTGYDPDTAKLLAADLKDTINFEYLSSSGNPIVLIIHTHATESYSPDGAISYYDDGGEYARTSDTNKNVVAVGKVLADELNKAGISTLHSTILHDALQYKDSYARSEETIRHYLEKYPTIRLVIDLHRDAIVKSGGELVRPVALSDGEAAAQVMCVVGSDFGGQECANWEKNLSLALKLREELNSKNEGICRPPYLRPSTYNQELAPYSLLIEVGASGNSLEEAKRSAVIVSEALTKIIKQL